MNMEGNLMKKLSTERHKGGGWGGVRHYREASGALKAKMLLGLIYEFKQQRSMKMGACVADRKTPLQSLLLFRNIVV